MLGINTIAAATLTVARIPRVQCVELCKLLLAAAAAAAAKEKLFREKN